MICAAAAMCQAITHNNAREHGYKSCMRTRGRHTKQHLHAHITTSNKKRNPQHSSSSSSVDACIAYSNTEQNTHMQTHKKNIHIDVYASVSLFDDNDNDNNKNSTRHDKTRLTYWVGKTEDVVL